MYELDKQQLYKYNKSLFFMSHILITGGAGFIGYHLSYHLSQQNNDVTVIDNFARSEKDVEFKQLIARPNVHFVKGDITDPQTLEGLVDTFDYVYHLAMINGTKNFYEKPHEVIRVGVMGTLNILDWMAQKNQGKLLFASSSEAYAGAFKIMGEKFPIPTPEDVPLVIDDPTNVRWSYAASKMIGEVAMHSFAHVGKLPNYAIVRYHNIYGPRMGFDHVVPQVIERIIQKENPFKVYGAQQTRTFCYIDDAVDATQLVMEHKETNGKTIHIGRDDDEIKIKDLVENLFTISEYHPTCEEVSAPQGSTHRRCPDTTKLKNLGFRTRVDLYEGLHHCFDWYTQKFFMFDKA